MYPLFLLLVIIENILRGNCDIKEVPQELLQYFLRIYRQLQLILKAKLVRKLNPTRYLHLIHQQRRHCIPTEISYLLSCGCLPLIRQRVTQLDIVKLCADPLHLVGDVRYHLCKMLQTIVET